MNKLIMYFFFSLLFFFTIMSSGVVDSTDGFAYLAVARNIYYKGEPVMQPYEFNEAKNIHMATYIGINGKSYSPTGLGYSLSLIPAVAITDVIYKHYNIAPPVHFPLESDWIILTLSSLTNGFFASLLGVTLAIYLITLGLKPKQALLISTISLLTTNLFVYAKHSFAHMMFVTFLFLSFLAIKKYFQFKSKKYLILAGIFYGVVSITYNLTFILTFPPLVIYCFALNNFKLSFNIIRSGLKNAFIFLLGMLPFIIIYLWFENTRSGTSLTDVTYLSSYAKNTATRLPIPVFIEGIYGQLLSPGRSFFLYSPLLILPILFWHKIRKTITPEVAVFISMSFIYVVFYAYNFSVDKTGLDFQGLWHGESSWGPRYLTPLIPFGMLIVGSIFTTLSKKQKIFIFLPLAIFGLYIEILGILMPYQIKYHDTEKEFYINGTQYTRYVYTDLLPRYSPILMMSKNLIKLEQILPKTLDHGTYNVKLYDGIDFPFNVGQERWRVIEGTGYISFDNKIDKPVQKMAFGLINHPIGESSSSAHVQFLLNNHPLLPQAETFALRERKIINLPINGSHLLSNNNQLVVQTWFDDPKVTTDKSQILGLIFISINDVAINLESLDFPYLSPLGPLMTNIPYQNYGGTNKDLMKSWDIHTQIFERVPDLWWAKAIYYWDFPKKWLLGIFVTNIFLFLFFTRKVYKLSNKF